MKIQVPLSPWEENASSECERELCAPNARLQEIDITPVEKNPRKLHIDSGGLKSSIRRNPLVDVGNKLTPLHPANAIRYSDGLPTYDDERAVHHLPAVDNPWSSTPPRNVASHPVVTDAAPEEDKEQHSKSEDAPSHATRSNTDEAKLEALQAKICTLQKLLESHQQSSRESIQELHRELAAKDRTCALLKRQNHWLRQTTRHLADERAADADFAAEELAVVCAEAGRPSMGECGTCLEFQRLYDGAVTRSAVTEGQLESVIAHNTTLFRQINYVNTVLKTHRKLLEAGVPPVARLARELSVWCEKNKGRGLD